MSSAREDLWQSLASLRNIAGSLGPAPVGQAAARSEPQLILNGLHIAAFSSLEDFVRRRAHEVITWLGAQGVHFSDFPEVLQTLILRGTIEGVSFSLSRVAADQKVTHLQIEGMLLAETGENKTFVPSNYFFGKSSSNIAQGAIISLLEAFGLGEKFSSASKIIAALGSSHLGTMGGIWNKLSTNRHSAAHAFSSDYRPSDFINDMNSSMPIFAFALDTVLSQCAIYIRKKVVSEKVSYLGYDQSTWNLRVIQFDALKSHWTEMRDGKHVKVLTKGQVAGRMDLFKTKVAGKDDSIIKIDGAGRIDEWIQPF